ncbi:MAG: ankyrin repeat domain-containing protein [Verrucomicrobia bacterium]|nr:ankyrin repeat domain-containing protein [Verrucomicrobiota bacterium]
MPQSLPPRPNLEHLKNQAKDLLRSYRAGDPSAARRFRESSQSGQDVPDAPHPAPSISLANAQCVIAREYGFESWTKLKEHVEAVRLDSGDPMELCHEAFKEDDAALLRLVLERHPALKARINDPIGPFDSPPLLNVRSRAMLDVLLEAGADINARSRWWAGGFGLLDQAPPELANYAIQRGAVIDVHAAARLGFLEKLRERVEADPALVHARGGDGQTPLHFASTVEIAAFLLDHGAEIDARDVDHESTPAQYMLSDRQDIARFLVQRGCRTDLLMAASLGDLALTRRHLDADPGCIHLRVTDEFFPKSRSRSGGTIYQWTLGWHASPHEVAERFGHVDVARLLQERSSVEVRLIVACWAGNEDAVGALLGEHPGLTARLSEAYRRHVAHAARNNKTDAVRLMLEAGLPIDALGQHRATPLHWASFHGNADMARVLLRYNPPLEARDADFASTPLGWAIHGSQHGWHCKSGDYVGVVTQLLAAGAKIPDRNDGSEEVKAAIRAATSTPPRR